MSLHNHSRQEIVARTMLKNLVSVDIRGNAGAGKSTLLQNLLKSFNTPGTVVFLIFWDQYKEQDLKKQTLLLNNPNRIALCYRNGFTT